MVNTGGFVGFYFSTNFESKNFMFLIIIWSTWHTFIYYIVYPWELGQDFSNKMILTDSFGLLMENQSYLLFYCAYLVL